MALCYATGQHGDFAGVVCAGSVVKLVGWMGMFLFFLYTYLSLSPLSFTIPPSVPFPSSPPPVTRETKDKSPLQKTALALAPPNPRHSNRAALPTTAGTRPSTAPPLPTHRHPLALLGRPCLVWAPTHLRRHHQWRAGLAAGTQCVDARPMGGVCGGYVGRVGRLCGGAGLVSG